MKKGIMLCILAILLAYLGFSRYIVQFVWVNPNVNINTLPYIANSIKNINKALDYSAAAMNSEDMDVKILYKNAYGSGFLKNNPIPNDLDYSVGVHLGKYEYDGQNSYEIAKSIDEKMTLFQTELYNYINTTDSAPFYSNYDVLSSIQKLFEKRDSNINAIKESIPQLFNHKDYVIYTNKKLIDNDQKEIPMTFPFILKKNEILIEDYSPIELYTRLVKYDESTRDFLREVTIVIDFYVDIQKGTDLVKAEIVAESFTGQRLQLSRRFFVPIVFADNASYDYLKNFNLINNDNDYVEYRMFNFKRHLQEFSNLKELQEKPIKLFKRVLQCTDLILPILDKNIVEDITTTIQKNLDNPTIKLINDYQTALSNLLQICSMPNLYIKAQYQNQIAEHLNALDKISEEMKKDKGFDKNDVEIISNFSKKMKDNAKLINSSEKLKLYYKISMKDVEPIYLLLDKMTDDAVIDKEKILNYIVTFDKIMDMAGFHKIDLCWVDKNLLGVVKDKFTSTINETDLKKMAQANKLADVNYKFISKSYISGPKVRYSVWVRYNSTQKQNDTLQKMKQQLLDDKKNYSLKRQFVILR